MKVTRDLLLALELTRLTSERQDIKNIKDFQERLNKDDQPG